MGIQLEEVQVENPDTSRVPDSGPTVASRTCMVVGRVLQLAAREVKEKLLKFAAEYYGEPEAQFRNGFLRSNGNEIARFTDVVAEYRSQRGALQAIAEYQGPPNIEWDDISYSEMRIPLIPGARRLLK